MYASIKNMTSFQEHPESSFFAKCLSSLHSMWSLMGCIPWATFDVEGVLPRGGACHHVIVVFSFAFLFWSPRISSATIWIVAKCGKWHSDKDNYQLSSLKNPQFSKHHFDKFWAQRFCGDFCDDLVCGPFFQRAFVCEVAELLVAEKPFIGARLTEVLTKRSTVEVVKARCHYCSSKPCLSFGAKEPRSLQQTRLCKNHNSGTATSLHCLKWS